MIANRRPERLTVLDEQGRRQSLPSGPDQFQRYGPALGAPPATQGRDRLPAPAPSTGAGGAIAPAGSIESIKTDHAPGSRDALFLGLGPEPEIAAALAQAEGATDVAYVETDAFLGQAGPGFLSRLPAAWRRMDIPELTPECISRRSVFFYARGLRLFPSFWGPVSALLRQAQAGPFATERTNAVLLPCASNGLLREEIADSLAQLGCKPVVVAPEEFTARLPALLAAFRPLACLSVNFQGLDPLGESFHLLDRAGVPVAVWCVDNPFHLLSGLRSNFWRKTRLFVTDDWFVEPLRRLGAQRVRHLPLAAWRGFAERAGVPGRVSEGLQDRLVFVGRSEFPGKGGYFAGVTLPPGASEAAASALEAGVRPDFAWQLDRLGAKPEPGPLQRQASLAAEEAGRMWRTRCLEAAGAAFPLTVFGDAKWRELLPDVDLRPMVDYYGPLASIYRSARFSLNATSLLLPRGLTQRHFDVWAAGGFLVSDATPGLSLFPDELTREISFARPQDLDPLLCRLDRGDGLREELRHSWRTLVMTEHTYVKRVEAILAEAM